jgi:hypothetical protein
MFTRNLEQSLLTQLDSTGPQVWHPNPSFPPIRDVIDTRGHIAASTASTGPRGTSGPATAESLEAENERLKLERNYLKRRIILWTIGLVTVIIILASVWGGLARKFLHQDKNSAQGSFTSPGASTADDSTLTAQSTGRTVLTESSFVTPVSTAEGSTIYSTVTASELIFITNQNSANSVTNAVAVTAIITVPPIQGNWRHCENCHSMFYDGFTTDGVCVKGGGHVASKFNFDLPHDIPPTAATQDQWRYCKKCFLMFFNGDINKGTCATGAGHLADGYVFVLPHDIPSTASTQDQWRHCNKCHTLFFDGNSNKGLCAVGGGHVADSFNFVLPHDLYSG